MDLSPKIFVEFIAKPPGEVADNDAFMAAECKTVAQAEELERKFHSVGWVARIVIVEPERKLLR